MIGGLSMMWTLITETQTVIEELPWILISMPICNIILIFRVPGEGSFGIVSYPVKTARGGASKPHLLF
jgi:hypothetical protein